VLNQKELILNLVLNKHIALKLFQLLVISSVLLTVTSCKTKKALVEPRPSYSKSKMELTEQFLQRADYQFVTGKAKVSVSSPYGSVKGTMYLRTIKDSLIWIAFKKLSVEAGRALITPDSLFFISRLEKSYQKHALSDVYRDYGLAADFSYIQDLVLGLTPTIDTTEYWTVDMTPDSVTVSTTINNILHKFFVDSMTGMVLGGTFKDKFNADGEWTFKDYVYSIDSIPVPAHREYQVHLNSGDELRMKINITELEVDSPKSIRFSIPDHYTRTY